MLNRVLARLGRMLRPLFNPDAERQLAETASIRKQTEEVGKQLSRQREELAKLRADTLEAHRDDLTNLRRELAKEREAIKDVQTHVTQLEERGVAGLRASLVGLRSSVDRQAKLASKAMQRAEGVPRWIHDEQRTTVRLSRIAKGTRPIVVGPWTGEVGFELLYWAPFVRWAVGHYGIDPQRLLVVSRGGTGSWYGLDARYEDALRLCTAGEFRAGSEDVKKQRMFSAFDREVVRRVRRVQKDAPGTSGGRPHLLHPALMYQLFWPYWREELTYRHVLHYTHQRLIVPPAVPAGVGPLPEEYVAVRFYFSSCFPDTPPNRALVASTIRQLAGRSDVVVLNSGLRLDDHGEFTPDASRRIHVVSTHGEPHTNLAVQTAVIGRARQFVGTYGGFSYLAPYLGVDTVAFYSVRNFRQYHLELAQRVFGEIGGGMLLPVDAAKAPLVAAALAGGLPGGRE
ncbi:MAG: hypothetical protein HY824_10130 [Acidobacteria bacterium]|nr:hypothetical protein [Acidobacteriota bacterium]